MRFIRQGGLASRMSCKGEAFARCDRLCGLGLFVLFSYQLPGDLARQSVEPARRALRRETARTMEAAAADACSELGANLVEPEVPIGNRDLVAHAVRKIFCQPRDPTDAGFIRLFRLYQLHKRGASMTERLHPPGMVPQRSGGRVHERVSRFRPRRPDARTPAALRGHGIRGL